MSESGRVNLMDMDEFQERVNSVFNTIAEALKKSFGPFGANTFVSKYPDIHTTKDGFTIMKAIEFEDHIDTIIKTMISAICSRLNDAVGDGTTTATVATAAIYDAYMTTYRDDLYKQNISPREILKGFERIKTAVIEELNKTAQRFDFKEDPDAAYEMIRSVVSIASNDDDEITKIISDIYKEAQGAPAIDCVLPESGTTKVEKIEGYHIDTRLMDGIYINNENRSMKGEGDKVIIFDHKVTLELYRAVLKPLAEMCRAKNKHLIVIAPYYDEVALDNTIRRELVSEFRASNRAPIMVLTAVAYGTGYDRKSLNDLAMLLNTEIISSDTAKRIISLMKTDFSNMNTLFSMSEEVSNQAGDGEAIQLGTAYKYELSPKGSVFSELKYSKEVYELYLEEARRDYETVVEKNRSLGISNTETYSAMKRYNALTMKSYRIEIGGASKLIQRYNKDVFDDAVRAAHSAYDNGVVLGCNVDTITILRNMNFREIDGVNPDLGEVLGDILCTGFESVYKTVLLNSPLADLQYAGKITDFLYPAERKDHIQEIVDKSVETHKVYNPVTMAYTDKIINSVKTDVEVLSAAIDLISLLISGNQMVILDKFIRENN